MTDQKKELLKEYYRVCPELRFWHAVIGVEPVLLERDSLLLLQHFFERAYGPRLIYIGSEEAIEVYKKLQAHFNTVQKIYPTTLGYYFWSEWEKKWHYSEDGKPPILSPFELFRHLQTNS